MQNIKLKAIVRGFLVVVVGGDNAYVSSSVFFFFFGLCPCAAELEARAFSTWMDLRFWQPWATLRGPASLHWHGARAAPPAAPPRIRLDMTAASLKELISAYVSAAALPLTWREL